MKRTKFAGILLGMLIFGSSTVFGATPSINLQNNPNKTVTVTVQDIPKDIYGIQIELEAKDILTKDIVFEAKDKDAYSFTVRNGNKLRIYITSSRLLNVGKEAVLGNLLDVYNDQFSDSASYKVIDYFFNPVNTPNADVNHTGDSGNTGDDSDNSGQPGDTDDSESSGQPGDTDDSGNTGQPGDTNDSGNTGGSGSTGGSSNSGSSNTPNKPTNPGQTEQPVLPTVEFTDTTNHWAAESISKMAARGILKGYEDGTFGPSKQITRAEFAAVVARAFGFEETATNVPLKDVQSGKWYTESVVSLYQKGIITGRPDGTFGVNDLITNQEMAVMISRSIKALAVELEAQKTYVPFVDADTISSFAQDAVKELYEIGIIAGMPDGTYQPKASSTRAQVAVIVDRMLTMIDAK